MTIIHKQAYVTDDGRAFDTQSAAQEYERRRRLLALLPSGSLGQKADFQKWEVENMLLNRADEIARIVRETPLASKIEKAPAS